MSFCFLSLTKYLFDQSGLLDQWLFDGNMARYLPGILFHPFLSRCP